MLARRRWWKDHGLGALVGLALALQARLGHADLPPQSTVVGADVTRVRVGATLETALTSGWETWSSLATTRVAPGPRWLTFPVLAGTDAVLVPVCAGRGRVFLDETEVRAPPGPLVVDLPRDGSEHRVAVELAVSSYEHRVACGAPPRLGSRATSREGLLSLTFAGPQAVADGHAAVYVPPGHDTRRPGALLVGLHPWNGSIWTYAAYGALLDAARAADVLLLFPSGLGNSLYTSAAEDEVMQAIASFRDAVAVDPDRVTLFGASMGGAGATTIGFHHPDAFAAIISFFGDSRYDLTTYVRSILHDGAEAHRVNALDIVDNARNVPVWLVHGEDDHVSSPAQSAMLARALAAKGFAVTFDRVPRAGHEGRLVTERADRIIDLASRARRTVLPVRVSYWSVRPSDNEAYGVRLTRTVPTTSATDAFFDLERVGDTLHLYRALGVRALALPRGAFGFAPRETPPVECDDPGARGVVVAWDALP
jgi:pimeloyl-ACP methyl ester carboxylesterase